MTNTIRAKHCLVTVLSFLMLGCANKLPELPIDVKKSIAATPVSINTAPASAVNIIMPLELIANDLVKALSFISGMGPQRSSIYTSTTGSEFDGYIKNSMLQQGYRFDGKRSATGSQQLTTAFRKTDSASQTSELTAIMAINSVLIKRTYLLQNDAVTPKSSYVISGLNPELVDSSSQVITL